MVFLSGYRPAFALPVSFNGLSVGNRIWLFSFFRTAFFCRDTGLFSSCRRHLSSICREWNLTFLHFYDRFFCSDTDLFPPCRRHLRSICREWHLAILLFYPVPCLTHTSLTPVLRGKSITNAPLITQSKDMTRYIYIYVQQIFVNNTHISVPLNSEKNANFNYHELDFEGELLGVSQKW